MIGAEMTIASVMAGSSHILDALDRVAGERDVARRRQPRELHAEDDDQDDAGDEGGRREPDRGEAGHEPVEVLAPPDRRQRRGGDDDQRARAAARASASSIVAPIRSEISVVTGNWLKYEPPKSPWKMPPIQWTYWSGIDSVEAELVTDGREGAGIDSLDRSAELRDRRIPRDDAHEEEDHDRAEEQQPDARREPVANTYRCSRTPRPAVCESPSHWRSTRSPGGRYRARPPTPR